MDIDAALPVEACLPALRDALAGRGVAVLQAPPGSGKTTIVPLRLLDEPWLAGRRIVMLEPRRLATRAAARRMAWLTGGEVGGAVGYRTRDERRSGPDTRVEVVTEGILTRRLQRDPELPGVGLVIFDEFHERSLQADLGLALALDARRGLRPDLRLLVMSATLDGDRVAALLDGEPAPVITGEGRPHPVDVRWAPKGRRERPAEAAAAAVRKALRDEPGDVLVFLPGAGDIRRAERELADGTLDGGVPVDVRPLFGALPVAEQDAAVAPSVPGRRKVVLSTDIAETSLTVEGVRVVVDAGLARVPRFDPRTGMTRLETVPASKASADQRAGRAGRTQPGVAYRLWSKLEHAARRPYSDPEITQVDLAGLASELALWGVTEGTDSLAFLDPPPARALEEGRALLRMLGALDGEGRITPLGRTMVGLPLHPRLAHLVAVSADTMGGALACVIAALLEDRDVLRGHPDELTADLAERITLIADPGRRHPHADGRALRAARDRADDLARRAGVPPVPIDPHGAGPLLALAYPDRLAQARGGRGRFKLRTGSGAWLPETDPLAGEAFLVAADLDGNRRDARIRLAAPLDAADVEAIAGDDVVEHLSLAWDRERDDLVARVERRLGELSLGVVERRPDPGPAVQAALLERIRSGALSLLPWTTGARAFQARVAFVRTHLGDPWPDLSDGALGRTLDEWLVPFLAGVTGRADVERLDLTAILRARLPYEQQRDLDRLAPPTLTLPGGRRVTVDYATDPPVLAVRVQEVYGMTETPAVLGGKVPVVLHLLSPAGRPVQITSDLAGFWQGSWKDVRKDMAGRYPKHDWPEDPTAGR